MAKYGESLYGVLQYGEELQPIEEDIQPYKPDLMRYLPYYYASSTIMKAIQDAYAEELGYVYYFLEDFLKQFLTPTTATWGLAFWEQELGLKTDTSKTYEERREIILSRLRGMGTVGKDVIKRAAGAFSGGDVDVIEYPAEYKFVVKFIGVKGIPRNMQGFIDMLEIIKPAHLAYEFKYTYTVWQMLKDWGIVWGKIDTYWDDISSLTWDEINNYTWLEARKIAEPEHSMTWNELKVYEDRSDKS